MENKVKDLIVDLKNALTVTYIYSELTAGYSNFLEKINLHYKKPINNYFLFDLEKKSRENIIIVYINVFDNNKITTKDCHMLNQVLAEKILDQFQYEKKSPYTITIYVQSYTTKNQFEAAQSFYNEIKDFANSTNPPCIITCIDCQPATSYLLNSLKINNKKDNKNGY